MNSQDGRSVVRLETPRLVLREFEPEDWRGILVSVSDAEVMKYMEPPSDEVAAKAFLSRAAQFREASPRTMFYLAATLRGNGELIGTATLSCEDADPRTPYFGIILNRSCWRKGYATEVWRALAGFAFASLNADRLGGACSAANQPSRRLMEHLGMTLTTEVAGPYYPIARYAIARETWERTHAAHCG